ncbi:MAG: hypothetical protein IJU60_05580 [Acholeplasmatales bacterium]|nr:hypothetical protein [Acholeplasmatales bacterium]
MKRRTLLILNLIFIFLSLVGALVLGFIFNFDIRFFYATLFTTMGISMGNELFILLGFLVVDGYDVTTYRLAREASYLVVAIGSYYILRYAGGYDRFAYLYWILTYLVVAIAIVIFIILDKREIKKQKNKPRIVANKR